MSFFTKNFSILFLKKKDVLAQLINDHLRSSTTMQTPVTPSIDIGGLNNINRNNNDDDDEQNFYSAPPSRMFTKKNKSSNRWKREFLATRQHESSPSLFTNSNNPEHTRIYNQAVLLNSLIRNMVNESGIQNSSSNESCFSNDTQVKLKKKDYFVI